VLIVTTSQSIDWQAWLRRWDAQQTGYLPQREARFTAMLEVLAILLPAQFVAVDLCCGPGAVSQRLLQRFPQARSIAVDLDPVLLALGEGALGTLDGRLRWLDADLCDPDWGKALGETQVDAALSTTALHWLPVPDLVALYKQLGELIRPGGVFLNGDNMRFNPALPTFHKVAETVLQAQWQDEQFAQAGVETWDQYWGALRQEPVLHALSAERERRFAARSSTWTNASYDLQVAALREAGFREVGVIWQSFDDRVLMAVR